MCGEVGEPTSEIVPPPLAVMVKGMAVMLALVVPVPVATFSGDHNR